jgi:hypothetical protein
LEEVNEENKTRQKILEKIQEEKDKLKRNLLLEDYIRILKETSEERKID